jgi:hypothetical protein
MSTKKTLFGFFKLNDEGIKFKLYRPEITFPEKTKLEKFPDESIIEIGSNAYDAFVDGFVDIIANNELMPVDELSAQIASSLDNLFTTTYELVEEGGQYYGKEATILLQLVQEDHGPLKGEPTLRTKVRIGHYRPAAGNVIVRLEEIEPEEPDSPPDAMTAGMWAIAADDGSVVNLTINDVTDYDANSLVVNAYLAGEQEIASTHTYSFDDFSLNTPFNVNAELNLSDDVQYDISLILINDSGSSEASDIKTVTPFN